MKPLCRLWPAIEDVAGPGSVLTDWRSRLGQDFDAASSFLRPIDQYAQTYPDVNAPYLYYKVVAHSDDDIVGVPCRDGSTIALTKAEVLIYVIDHRRLCRSVAKALCLNDIQIAINGAGPVLVGTYRPCVGVESSVYFAIPHESADLQRAIEHVAAHDDSPFIFVAPTSRHARPDCSAILKIRKACFFPLADAVRLEADGQFVLTAWAEQALEEFRNHALSVAGASRDTVSSTTPPNPPESDARSQAPRVWPDPQRHTTAKAWTVKNGAFCLSTTTEREDDGKVEFPLVDGKPTKQMQLMRLICYRHPKPVAIAEIIEQVYPEKRLAGYGDVGTAAVLLKKVRSLISDIRNKKLAPNGINPSILPPLDIETSSLAEIGFRLAHLHKLDDIGFDDVAWPEAETG